MHSAPRLGFALLLLAGAAACSRGVPDRKTAGGAAPNPSGPTPLRVVTLSPVLTEIASEVGGPEVSAASLVRPGVDPHTFDPAPADLHLLAGADLILASGLGLEPYLDRLAVNSGTRARIVDVGAILADRGLYLEVNGRREPDPHWWNSVLATIRVTREVAADMGAMRPEAAGAFAGRADSYVSRLETLDRWVRAELSVLPTSRRQLVTSHDAFAWFAQDYGFIVHPINGISPEAEPNGRDLAALIDLIRRDRIPAVFVESSANPALVATITRETGARLGGFLYADGLSPDGDGVTYAGMIRHNVRTLAGALR